AGVDEGSGLIRRLVLTPARVNESLVADDLICGDERAVYGDKGYESKERRARLKARGIKDRIMHRSHKNQAALPRWQTRRNALIARRRAAVERVFGTLKRLHGLARARCSTPCPQPRRHDRLRDRPQPAPRRRPYPGLKTSRSPNAAAAPQSRAPDPAAATAGSRLIRLAPANPSVSQRSPEGEAEPRREARPGEGVRRGAEASSADSA
ncbi:MAG: transposase, partial [Microvirga sp.]